MTTTSVSEVLASANAAMVRPDLDVTGALAQLLAGVTAALPASAAAVLVDAEGALEVLAATSHRALHLPPGPRPSRCPGPGPTGPPASTRCGAVRRCTRSGPKPSSSGGRPRVR